MFDRIVALIGEDSLNKIKEKHILVIGVGGVGGYAVESLVRSGIENITLVDYDTIDISNINRQIIAKENNVDTLFETHYDYIVDACDTLIVKKLLIKRAREYNIKLITVCGMGKRLDPSKVRICDIKDTSYDPLAKSLRKYVKDEKIKGKIPVVFSSEEPKKNDKNLVSSMMMVPAVAGINAAYYVINDIIK